MGHPAGHAPAPALDERSVKCTQPMPPRMFFFSCWPHMTCGPRARFHRATIWGSAFLIVMGQMTRFIGPSAPWHAFAHWVQSWGV